jgi:hypothetical protein
MQNIRYNLKYIKTYKINIHNYRDISKLTDVTIKILVNQTHFNCYYEKPSRDRICAVCLKFLKNLM